MALAVHPTHQWLPYRNTERVLGVQERKSMSRLSSGGYVPVPDREAAATGPIYSWRYDRLLASYIVTDVSNSRVFAEHFQRSFLNGPEGYRVHR